MKKLFLLIVLTSSLSSSFAQQHLWSTKKLDDSTINIVSMDSAISNVLGFYDLYDYYYDMSGYSKENFINLFENPETFKSKEEKERLINQFNQNSEPNMFAIRTFGDKGSVIFVLFLGKTGVNMVIFSNNYSPGALNTGKFKRDKFSIWINSLLK